MPDTPLCITCRAWTEHPDAPGLGACRRRSPVPIVAPADGDDGEPALTVWTAWPETMADDGCLDHVAADD